MYSKQISIQGYVSELKVELLSVYIRTDFRKKWIVEIAALFVTCLIYDNHVYRHNTHRELLVYMSVNDRFNPEYI